MRNKNANTLVKIAALSAIAFLLQFLGSAMGLNVGGFLTIEFSDLPALIGAFALGPVSGVLIELVKNIFHCSITSTGFVGEFANFVTNGIFVFAAGLIYKKNRTLKGAVIGTVVAIFVMTAAAMLTNLFIMLPMFMPNADYATKLNLVLYTITPFNLCRGLALAVLTFLLYKRLTPILKVK